MLWFFLIECEVVELNYNASCLLSCIIYVFLALRKCKASNSVDIASILEGLLALQMSKDKNKHYPRIGFCVKMKTCKALDY